MLIHLIYSSVAVSAVSAAELQELLITSRRNNARINVTGMLLYADGAFFQAIEGEEQAVLSLYERLTHDKRHHSQTLIIREPIAKRGSRREHSHCQREYGQSAHGGLRGDAS